jgi:hypothetical protein
VDLRILRISPVWTSPELSEAPSWQNLSDPSTCPRGRELWRRHGGKPRNGNFSEALCRTAVVHDPKTPSVSKTATRFTGIRSEVSPLLEKSNKKKERKTNPFDVR